jgi:hypothetical protein
MIVTSDVYGAAMRDRYRRRDSDNPTTPEWRETLVGGVSFYGRNWPGPELAAEFMLEATRGCDLLKAVRWAGYDRIGEPRTRNVKLKSFEKIVRGELRGAIGARYVLLVAQRPAEGTEGGVIYLGGGVGASTGPREPETEPAFAGYFLFPWDGCAADRSCELLSLASRVLGCDYGYGFIRDEMGFPGGYVCGIGPGLYVEEADEAGQEIGAWADFKRKGGWAGTPPMLRDLFQVNLLSELHRTASIGGFGSLAEWIAARPGRGALRDIGGGRLLWTLTDREVFDVRPKLREAGLLFAYTQRVYRDLPGRPEQGGGELMRLHHLRTSS